MRPFDCGIGPPANPSACCAVLRALPAWPCHPTDGLWQAVVLVAFSFGPLPNLRVTVGTRLYPPTFGPLCSHPIAIPSWDWSATVAEWCFGTPILLGKHAVCGAPPQIGVPSPRMPGGHFEWISSSFESGTSTA